MRAEDFVSLVGQSRVLDPRLRKRIRYALVQARVGPWRVLGVEGLHVDNLDRPGSRKLVDKRVRPRVGWI
jgi:hypothetical protein